MKSAAAGGSGLFFPRKRNSRRRTLTCKVFAEALIFAWNAAAAKAARNDLLEASLEDLVIYLRAAAEKYAD